MFILGVEPYGEESGMKEFVVWGILRFNAFLKSVINRLLFKLSCSHLARTCIAITPMRVKNLVMID